MLSGRAARGRALVLAFTAATPAIFFAALFVLVVVVLGIVWLRRNRSAAIG